MSNPYVPRDNKKTGEINLIVNPKLDRWSNILNIGTKVEKQANLVDGKTDSWFYVPAKEHDLITASFKINEISSQIVNDYGSCAKSVCDGITVYDIGCGPGRSTLALAEKTFANYIGIDFEQKYIDKATEACELFNLQGRVKFIHGDALELDIFSKDMDKFENRAYSGFYNRTIFYLYEPFVGKLKFQFFKKLRELSMKTRIYVISLFGTGCSMPRDPKEIELEQKKNKFFSIKKDDFYASSWLTPTNKEIPSRGYHFAYLKKYIYQINKDRGYHEDGFRCDCSLCNSIAHSDRYKANSFHDFQMEKILKEEREFEEKYIEIQEYPIAAYK